MTDPLFPPPRFRLASYHYRLPEELIAQVPAAERARSRLMLVGRRTGVEGHLLFEELPGLLRPGDCLVVNDTRVIPARMFARKPSGGAVEILATGVDGHTMEAMFGARRGLKQGMELGLLDRQGERCDEALRVTEVRPDGTAVFATTNGGDARWLLARLGHVPLPPYIRRHDASLHDMDAVRYQTVYAAKDGAVAAPTAGLHFTGSLLETIRSAGVEVASLTLHVGPGTFRPVRTEDVRAHDVGKEVYDVPEGTADTVNRTLSGGGRVIAVGTTVVRTLETAGSSGRLAAGAGSTRLLICPGFRFRIVSAMVTNFHLPGSSLLLLVGAFAGRRRILAAYREAVRLGYRFYSYGDAMLIR